MIRLPIIMCNFAMFVHLYTLIPQHITMKLSHRILIAAAIAAVAFPADAKKKKDKTPSEPPKSAYCLLTGSDTVNMRGVMNVIEKGDSIFFELPTSLLGREFLVVNRLQQVPQELNESGVNRGINYENQTIRFEWDKKEKSIVIRQQRLTPLVDNKDAISRSVKENYIDPVIASIKVRAIGTDSATVVFPVNKLFNGKDNCLNDVFHNINIPNSPNSELSRIIRVKSNPRSVTATSEQTVIVHEGMDKVNVSVVVSSSIYLLDETPMEGREETARVGYFTESRLCYSDDQQEVKTKHFINRWRLEPKDKEAYMRGELVEPVKPIVFYLDQRIPASIRPAIHQGIEDWKAAFEKAGFKNAIMAADMTDSLEQEDDDMKYSVLTYAASEKANAMGPCVVDPRSGEILEADIIWWHNVRSLLTSWLKVQTGAIDARVRQPKLPNELINDAARFVATHEVGHSLGLRHNMIASAAYPTDSLRSKTFTDRVGGTAASIMDYARFNYIAQPGDGVTTLSPHIGPYDLMAIEWGYRWYPTEAEAKKPLAELLMKHTGKEYRYSETQNYRTAIDPRALSEDLGDNSVKSAKYGIDNLKRIMPHLDEWTRTGDMCQPWDDAADLWLTVISQWDLYNYHVLANIGGIYLDNTCMGDGKASFTYVEKERQKEALRYIINEVMTYPEWLFSPTAARYTYLLKNRREEHPSTSYKNEVSYIMWDMLNNDRILRMTLNEEENKSQAFTAKEMMDTLYDALFTRRQQPDLMQRYVQKTMVDALITAAAENEGVKINKSLYEDKERDVSLNCKEPLLSSKPRTLAFSSTAINRLSDPISIKRAILMRIRQFAKAHSGSSSTIQQMHYADIVKRIDTALGL